MNVNPYLFQQGDKTVEVVLTGRVAKKRRGRRIVELHEIESADKDLGFKQWVKMEQLFTIENNK